MKLYEISSQYQQALASFEDMDLPEEVIADTLEGLKGELEVKGKNIGAFIRNMEADIEAIKTAEQAMYARRKTLANRVTWLKTKLLEAMQQSNLTEISCPWFIIKPKKKPPSIQIDDESILSKKYLKTVTTTKIDKILIAKDLKMGAVVKGVSTVQGWRLDIK